MRDKHRRCFSIACPQQKKAPSGAGDASASPVLSKKKAPSGAGVHLLHAFSTKLKAAAGSLAVPPDSGETVEALELIKTLPLGGAAVTGGAAFTCQPIAGAIKKRGGSYFLFVSAQVARRAVARRE